MLRQNAHDRHGVRPDGKCLIHVELHGRVVDGLGRIQHGEIAHRALLLNRVISKCNVGRGQRLAVGELDVVSDGDRPSQAVLRHGIAGREIVADGQIGICDRERALNERLVNVFARAPTVSRVKTGSRFRIDIERDDNRIVCMGRFLCGRLCATTYKQAEHQKQG